MRQLLMITAALGFLALGVSQADAQKIDKNGRCHAANGQFAKAEVCGGARASKSAAPAAAAVDPNAPYKLDAKGKCHDVKGKMAKKTMCKAA
jgi:hypothetical protein